MFANPRIEQACASLATLRRLVGESGAKSARAQLATLRAASCLDELRYLPGRCRERGGRLTVMLADSAALVFEAAEDPQAAGKDGVLDWSAVRSIRILAISTHDAPMKG